jgi:hypothetical protein
MSAKPRLSKLSTLNFRARAVGMLILYEALGTATTYFHTFSEIGDSKSLTRYSSTTTDLSPQTCFPKYDFFTPYFAALSLYHFLSNLPQFSLPDQNLARNHIRLAHTLLSRCGISNSNRVGLLKAERGTRSAAFD